VETGKLFTDPRMPALDALHDRVMMCSNPNIIADLKQMLDARASLS
jgi:hypothetical protein